MKIFDIFKIPDYMKRPLWKRTADTKEGNMILHQARMFSMMEIYKNLTDGELIRLAYWGHSGEKN